MPRGSTPKRELQYEHMWFLRATAAWTEGAKARDLVRQLQALGHQVTLEPTAA
ncbi:hypothetical protein OG258_48770 [Streptomyces mirabilis]|uniref:hypothetical protein n=1 Tax=Streptomyces mirabilis TaxID=68239 RepID=UPI001605548E|nr:hypothetical protein [Streptomyces mirabilis]